MQHFLDNVLAVVTVTVFLVSLFLHLHILEEL